MENGWPAPSENHARFAARSTSDPAKTRAFAIELARLVHDDKCEDVLVLDVSGLSPVTDFLVIASGTSDRQMKAVLQHVADLGKEMGFEPFGKNADENASWLLCDFVDVIVHLFEPNTRAHYDLEMLWGDAKNVPWERTPEASPEDPQR